MISASFITHHVSYPHFASHINLFLCVTQMCKCKVFHLPLWLEPKSSEMLCDAAWPRFTCFADRSAHADICEWNLVPKELGLGDGGGGGCALLKCEAVLKSPDTTCLFVCDREQVHVLSSQTYMSVACDGEAVKAAAASSEFSHVARLGEQGKTSRHRRSQAIYRPPLPPAGKWGRGAT